MRSLLVFVLIFLKSFIYSQEAKTYNIAAVRVEGAKNLNNIIIVSLSELKVGNSIEIPGYSITNAIKNLWRQELFSDVQIIAERIQDNNIFLLIKVEEKSRMSKYKISGIKKSEIDELRAKLSLKTGMVVNDNLNSSINSTIKEYYKNKGFLNTKIKITDILDKEIKDNIVLNIDIDRGLKYKIRSINFFGNNEQDINIKNVMSENKERAHFNFLEFIKFNKHINDSSWSTYDLFGAINPKNVKSYVSNFLTPNVFRGAIYNPIDMKLKDWKSIKDHYSSLGYRDAKVLWDTAIFLPHQEVDLFLKIDEGKKYYFRNIEWIGNTKYSDTILNSILNINKGDIFNTKKLEEKLVQSQDGGDISSLYMDDGYLFFSIDPIEKAIIGDSIDLTMKIYEGNQATLNEINIFGNDRTNEKVIRRELRIRPGDKFSRANLIRSQRELMGLNYFNPETMQINPKPKEDGNVDLDIILEEKASDQVQLSLGFAQYVYGQVSLNFNNFSLKNLTNFKKWKPLPVGDGQTLSLNVQSSGLRNQVFNLSLVEPWLGGNKPISLQIAGTYSKYNNLDGSNILGSFVRSNLTAEVGSRLKWPDDYFNVFFGITIENNNLTNYSGLFSDYTHGNINNFYSKFTIARNSLQGPLGPQIYPTNGANLSFSVQATLPYSLMFNSRKLESTESQTLVEKWKWLEYHKWKFNADLYTPIVGNLVARISARFGAVGYYNSKYGVSAFERFKIGGDGLQTYSQYGQEIYSLRGYQDNEVTIDDNGKYIDGSVLFNKFIFELRYPLSLNPQSTIFGMLFAEAGNGWGFARDYDPFNLKKSIGAGIRFNLPMFGLLGFDYGLGIDKKVSSSLQNGSIFEKYGKFRFILGFEPQ